MTDPAPAAMPWMPEMIGTATSRMARIRSPVILVNAINSRGRILISSPMISLTSPPAQNALPWPRMTRTRTSSRYGNCSTRSRRSA